MKGKIILTIIGITLIVGAVGISMYKNSQRSKLPSPQADITINSPTPSLGKIADYTDPSGFIIKYPASYALKNMLSKNSPNYAEVSIISPDRSIKINISATDTNYKSLEEFLKSLKTNPSLISPGQLADMKAKELSFTTGLQTVAIDQGILFTISTETLNQKNEFKNIHKNIVSSFAFVSPTKAEQSPAINNNSIGDVQSDIEEVVE
ncbi:MAG: hypothetical protein Q7S61_03755 [bacterium]|nr:hypothetical protein [bacterium]